MKIGKFLNEIGENWNTYSNEMKEQMAILVLDSIGSKELFIKNMDMYESVPEKEDLKITNNQDDDVFAISSKGDVCMYGKITTALDNYGLLNIISQDGVKQLIKDICMQWPDLSNEGKDEMANIMVGIKNKELFIAMLDDRHIFWILQSLAGSEE